ncbi:hypothetical protein [Bosea sp. TAF32]|uniref:hypothetical protein n=1 Tax=Bosea sp. TAF32 TaxID=3237482 RepID=UPI003F937193
MISFVMAIHLSELGSFPFRRTDALIVLSTSPGAVRFMEPRTGHRHLKHIGSGEIFRQTLGRNDGVANAVVAPGPRSPESHARAGPTVAAGPSAHPDHRARSRSNENDTPRIRGA